VNADVAVFVRGTSDKVGREVEILSGEGSEAPCAAADGCDEVAREWMAIMVGAAFRRVPGMDEPKAE
jgi:hypothetical protein